ncbi:hypothetical protein [Coleofasciculus sp. H7-2]
MGISRHSKHLLYASPNIAPKRSLFLLAQAIAHRIIIALLGICFEVRSL